MSRAIPILYRDAHLVAVHKPAGVLVHRNPQVRAAGVPLLQQVRDQLGRLLYPVHRLDRPTSGLLVFALERESAARLGAAFAAGEVRKSYLAVVRGFTNESGEIDHALGAKPRLLGAQGRKAKGPQAAITRYRRLGCAELPEAVGRYPSARYSLLDVEPITGRQHQIRRHMKHIAHPIIGDTTHGDGAHNRFFRARFDCTRLLLACVAFALRHPVSGEPLVLRAPPEADFQRVLVPLGWDGAAAAYLQTWGEEGV